MRSTRWRAWLGIGLLAASAVLFYVHYLVFHDLHHLGIFTLHDIAFLPFEVLVVTLLLHAMIEWRERRELLQKLNMIIGAFFSEVGEDLLRRLASFDTDPEFLASAYALSADWTDAQLQAAAQGAGSHTFALEPTRDGAAELRTFMMEKRGFLLNLLGNQSLLENEGFTEVLWAVFHMGDELQKRTDVAALPDSDIHHLGGDMQRAYGALIAQWFEHLRHLNARYPYLFALSVRTNPLISDSGPVVTS